MAGVIDWTALPVITAMYGIEDVELFVLKLNAIRDHARLVQEAASGK